jgi:aldose 1-epimerase
MISLTFLAMAKNCRYLIVFKMSISKPSVMPVTEDRLLDADFSMHIHRKQTALFRLENELGMSVALTNYGARLVSLVVPDAQGELADIVLGYDTLLEYMHSSEQYFGATVGRFANRIANGKFSLHGVEFQLEVNDEPNHLHGGLNGFHETIWDAQMVDSNNVLFTHLSKDGASGYPGTVLIEVLYTLTEKGELKIDYKAVSEEPTIINLTNHAYFNLQGAGSGSIQEHRLYINADEFTPVNPKMIPTGEFRAVTDTPFDFRTEKEIGKDWNVSDNQLELAGGYDHNFVLNKEKENSLALAARVAEPVTGRIMEVETTEPGIQLYTANFLSGDDIGREGKPYKARTAFCLETQHFPDSPNQPAFPSVVLEPGKKFTSSTIFRFVHLTV